MSEAQRICNRGMRIRIATAATLRVSRVTRRAKSHGERVTMVLGLHNVQCGQSRTEANIPVHRSCTYGVLCMDKGSDDFRGDSESYVGGGCDHDCVNEDLHGLAME